MKRTAYEVSCDIHQSRLSLVRLTAELDEIRKACKHKRQEPRSSASCGAWRLWNVCLDCGEELNVTYDNDEGCGGD